MYILSNGKGQYICKDRFNRGGSVHETFGVTTNIQNAVVWDDEEKAKNIAKNCLGKSLRDRKFNAIKVENDDDPESEHTTAISESELQELLDDVMKAGKLMNNIEAKQEILSRSLSKVDKEITDIHHWMELGKFNAYQGYKAFAILQDRLRKRRTIKNGMAILRAMSGVENAVANAENRNYRPRVLNDLFEG